MQKNFMRKYGFRTLPILAVMISPSFVAEIGAASSMTRASETWAQSSSKKITGLVLDEAGEPVIGASILVKGTNYGVITDIDGKFELNFSGKATDLLVISFVGMKTVEQKIGNTHNFKITLQADALDLEEVIVVGYGTSSVKDLTGSVSSIGAKQLDQLNTPNVSSMLQNLASGVQVAQSTGKPGETVRVRVRGATSLTGSNEPLYVIDGVPVDDPTMLDAISPNDIQSMDVLKDASAAAIYGSRAANGVVIITTKKGTEGKPSVSFNYNFTADTQIQNFRILYGDEWRATVRRFAEQTLVFDPSNTDAQEILNPESGALGTANTDWFKEVYQPGFRQNADVSVSGGGKNAKYLLSLSVLDQQGMIKGGGLTRYNARISTEMSVLPILRFGLNATMSYTDQSNAGTSLFAAQGFRPDRPVYDSQGEFDLTDGSPNPVANTHNRDNDDIYRVLGTVYGEVDILKGLKFRSSLSANVEFNQNISFSPSYLSNRKEATGSENHFRSSKTVFDNVLSYNYEFNKNHAIDAVAGVSFESYTSRSTYISGKNYPDDDIYTNIGSATTITSWSNGYNAYGLFSSFGRINYKLMNRYLFTFTGRYDGSSMFGANNRYGFFPSGAFAWRISEENFMKNIKFVNELKLRLSTGVTGTQNLTSFSNRDLYEAGSYNGRPAIIHSQVGNRDIQWETSVLYDLGLDFALFDYKLTGSIGGYIKNTNDLIWAYNFPSSSVGGSMSMNRNVGAVTNRGVELNLTSHLIDKEDWKLSVMFNIAHNSNKVTRLVAEGAIQTGMKDVIIHGNGNQVLAEGYPMGVFLGYEHNGVIQSWDRVEELNAYAKEKGQAYYDGNELKPGNLELVDKDGNGKIENYDRVILGSPDPDVFGGFTFNVGYKRFALFANFGYQIGGLKLYNKAVQNLPGQLSGLVDYGLNDRWSPENPNAKLPALYIGEGVSDFTNLELFDASFLRLQEIRLTYDLPLGTVVKGQVFAAATNLFTITSYPGIDPATVSGGNYGGNYETANYPGFRSFSVGIKFNL